MCGIIGYAGYRNAAEVILRGLENLEYRGYDSAGMALQDEGTVKIYKTSGKLINLKNEIKTRKNELKNPQQGIGHIRWATHGSPSPENAHPHTCTCGKLAVVHNGIIENYKELREELVKKGCFFRSQTDTETIAHLIADEYGRIKNLETAVRNSIKRLQGAYALCVIHQDEPDTVIGARKHAPMLIGIGEGENFIASDTPAIIEYTKKAVYLDDNEIAAITKNTVKITDTEGGEIKKKIELLPWESVSLNKMGYKHFMLKEIHEQPDIIRNILSGRLAGIDAPVYMPEIKFDKNTLKKISKIQIAACGTSLHAAMAGKYLIEDFAGIAAEAEASSEYIYRKTVTDASTLVIGVSQSGETADTITAVKQAKAKGAHILIITNRPDSNMARLADSLIPLNAGIEASVAATKSYTAQLVSFYLLALYLAELKGSLDEALLKNIKHELIQIPSKIEAVLSDTAAIQDCARRFSSYKNFIYIARGINLASALEGALKLKEISYINAAGYAAGELKHGPIAMLDETMPVLSIMIPGSVTYEKVLSNSEEAKARNAKLIALTSSNDKELNKLFDTILKVPPVSELLSPLLTCVPLQLLAYYTAEYLGKDVDQPRNLAKSVTVE